MTRAIASVLLALLLLAAPATAATPTDAAALASLDKALTAPLGAASSALDDLAVDAKDQAAQSRMSAATVAGVAAVDLGDVRPCFADWAYLTRTAFWLLGASIYAIDAEEAAQLALDNGAAQAAHAEALLLIPPAVSLLRYAPTLRAKVDCGPTPAGTGAP